MLISNYILTLIKLKVLNSMAFDGLMNTTKWSEGIKLSSRLILYDRKGRGFQGHFNDNIKAELVKSLAKHG